MKKVFTIGLRAKDDPGCGRDTFIQSWCVGEAGAIHIWSIMGTAVAMGIVGEKAKEPPMS